MSCFGLRVNKAAPQRADLPASNPPTPPIPPPSDPSSSTMRRHFRRNITFNSKSSSDSTTKTPTPVPMEDLGSTKRRLVCIRRQSEYAPVNLSVGFKSRTGWQLLTTSSENQDSLAVVLPLPDPLAEYSLFAVFDGHGHAGHRVSAFVAENVAKHFRTILGADKTTPVDVALRKAYMRTTKALLNHQTLDILITGTTAVVAIVHGRQLTCANVGDSRIVLGTVRKGIVAPLALTTDHLPEDPLEKERIEKAGGRVESWAPAGLDTGPPRVWLKEKRIPGLSISRVIGDEILSGIVSSEPDVSTHQLAEEDRFLIVATDGIWGVMSNEEVINFVAARDGESCQRVAEGLVRHAAVLWFDDGGESIDDISAIVVRFNW